MRLVFEHLSPFVAKWRSLDLVDEDLQALEALLMHAPTSGPVMNGTGGLRKVRFSSPSRGSGKSGAMRVCYAYFPLYARIFLVTIFAKGAAANLTKAERNSAAQLLKAIDAKLRAGGQRHA